MITYQKESWAEFIKDALPILGQMHYDEFALDKNGFKLDLNLPVYEFHESRGEIYIGTVRDDGIIAGYVIMGMLPHLHYASSGTIASSDMYFVHPKYRNGCGLRLLVYMEDYMRENGIMKIYLSHKLYMDHGKLFSLLGYGPTDMIYTKFIGGK